MDMSKVHQSLDFLPDWAAGLIIAAVIIIAGYFISKIAEKLIAGAINRTGLGKKAVTTGGNIGRSLGKAVFWVLWLIFILMGLGQFDQLDGALAPVNGMIDSILEYLPKFAAGIGVLIIGLILSKVVKEALTSTLEVAQVDTLATRFNLTNQSEAIDATPKTSIARGLGGLAGALVVIFFAITALGIWDIPNISEDVSDMLQKILNYIPNIIAAVIILGIAIFIGRFVSNLAQNTLPALGVDNSLNALGGLDGQSRGMRPSKLIGTIAFIAIALMGLTAAMKALGIPELTQVFNQVLEVGGRIVLGAIIIGVGVFVASIIARIVTEAAGDLAGKVVKYAAILLFVFMGLNAMEVGQDIVNTAFQYTLGAAAVAAGIGGAIAFGMGGRQWAADKLQAWWPAKKTPTRKR